MNRKRSAPSSASSHRSGWLPYIARTAGHCVRRAVAVLELRRTTARERMSTAAAGRRGPSSRRSVGSWCTHRLGLQPVGAGNRDPAPEDVHERVSAGRRCAARVRSRAVQVMVAEHRGRGVAPGRRTGQHVERAPVRGSQVATNRAARPGGRGKAREAGFELSQLTLTSRSRTSAIAQCSRPGTASRTADSGVEVTPSSRDHAVLALHRAPGGVLEDRAAPSSGSLRC